MKKSMYLIAWLLAAALLFSGCGAASAPEQAEEPAGKTVQAAAIGKEPADKGKAGEEDTSKNSSGKAEEETEPVPAEKTVQEPENWDGYTLYVVEELDMEIRVPEEFTVFTRDMQEDDPGLDKFMVSRSALLNLMETGDVYLYSLDETESKELIVTMTENPIQDYNILSNELIESMLPMLEVEYETMGADILASEIYHGEDRTYVRLLTHQKDGANDVYGIQYNTICNYMAINVTLQSLGAETDEQMEEMVERVVDSVRFGVVQTEESASGAEPAGEGLSYTDPLTGLSFALPAGWTEEPMMEERDIIDAKFITEVDDLAMFVFASEDMLSEENLDALGLGGLGDVSYMRPLMDNSLMTKEDVALAMGVSPEEVSTVTYGGREYYRVSMSTGMEDFGLAIFSDIIVLERIENGYMYMFQFSSENGGEEYLDEIMSTVVYPAL